MPQLAALLASVVLGGVVMAMTDAAWAQIPVGILILVCLLWFGVRYARWVTTNFVVTTDRLIYRHGVLSKHGIEIPLDRVNTVFFRQSLFGGSSARAIWSRVGQRDRPPGVQRRARPNAVQNEIYLQIEANENRKYDRVGASMGGPDDPRASIPAQIRELDELRKQGLLTEAEFAAKKRQLLDRM